MKRSPAGFTLIELLIVVAIIAILAAIAVPNFLHAQMRAKIARVMADMRNVAIAVEAYAVDYGVYPPTQSTLVTLGSTQNSDGIFSGFRLVPCTTPVAYISDLPIDPFSYVEGRQAGRGAGPNLPPNVNFTPYPLPYFWRNVTEVIVGGQVVHDISIAGGGQIYWIQKMNKYPIWVMYSFGPDLDYRGSYLDPTYDPSNGLFSDGDIFLLGPGNEFVKKTEG